MTLKVFQATGGIEKVCRIVGKALFEKAICSGENVQIYSMYDNKSDAYQNQYFPSEIFKGYGKRKWLFVLSAIWNARKSDVIIMSHINLLVVGWIIKRLYPKKQIILFAHGIEIWSSLSDWRKRMLHTCDKICSVSHFTKNKIIKEHKLSSDKNFVLNNCIDPYLPTGTEYYRNGPLRDKLKISESDFVLFTLSRLASRERYKGYDLVVNCLPDLLKIQPNIKYIIGGIYDTEEKEYLEKIALNLGVNDHIILTGFIPESELVEYFKMSDVYIMPSIKEGFGIVFVEAMYYGLPVIAGNKDGSVDALLNGELGILVDPEHKKELVDALHNLIKNRNRHIPDQKKIINHFGYSAYKKKLESLLCN